MLPSEPLAGRVALVTGVSRDVGIGAEIARRLHRMGATVFATGWPPHDGEMPWAETRDADLPVALHRHDLEQHAVPGQLIDEVVNRHGAIDIVAGVHARSSSAGFATVGAAELDRCWAANVRSMILLAQRFAEQHQPAPPDTAPIGRMVWFTSGQNEEPMDGEIAYAVTKGALHQMTKSINKALSHRRIVANCINPGPVDTGWADAATQADVVDRFPDRRWGTPADVANLVAFLVSDEGAWIRGQVLDSEGGFDRF